MRAQKDLVEDSAQFRMLIKQSGRDDFSRASCSEKEGRIDERTTAEGSSVKGDEEEACVGEEEVELVGDEAVVDEEIVDEEEEAVTGWRNGFLDCFLECLLECLLVLENRAIDIVIEFYE